VNVIGIGRKTGKTRLVRELLQQLRKRGFRISTIKHIAEGSFDTAYKDTWQHLQAGAVQVTALSSNELITIKRVASPSLHEVLKTLSGNNDMILVEGFKASEYPKIIVARTTHEVDELIQKTSNIIAISGSILQDQPHLSSYQGLPLLPPDELVSLLVHRFQEHAVSYLPSLDCGRCGYRSCDKMAHAIMNGDAVITQCKALFDQNIQLTVNGLQVSLSAFPATFIRNTMLGMIATLHGAQTPKKVTLNIQVD
jgi:molybdopterin-guanine dinucleotide biosynthesis protein B